MERAFSTIALKTLDEEKREFSGLATSPVPDRVLDIIEPLGAKYQNPTVLLRAHAHDAPIGRVFFDRPTKTGIGFRANIPKIEEPGLLKDRVDMAWGEIKHGLVRAVSIGFRPTADPEPLPTGGLRFPKTEIYELSTVAVPAQALATIDEVKAIDAAIRRGETRAPASTLWDQVRAAGRVGLDRAEREWNEAFQKMLPAERKHAAHLCQGQFLQGSSHEMLKFLAGRMEAAERRLEQQGPAYKGIWKQGVTYPAGSFVTHAGSMWHADKATDFKPGEGGGWTLAVKRGASAREAG